MSAFGFVTMVASGLNTQRLGRKLFARDAAMTFMESPSANVRFPPLADVERDRFPA